MKCLPIRAIVLAMICAALSASNARAAIYVFGDSLSDTGNFSIATQGQFPPTPLYSTGRFTNGPVWVEYLAQALHEPAPSPSLSGGTNNAFNGSRAAGVSPYGTPSVMFQVSTFLAAHDNRVDANDYFVIWAGANDIFFGPVFGETNFIGEAVVGIVSSIDALRAAGARKIIVLNLPPLGQTPYVQANPGTAPLLDAATFGFNQALAAALSDLEKNRRQLSIAQVDIWGLFEDMIRNPQKYRLNNTQIASTLFDANSGVSLGYALNPDVDPNRSLFWDGVHPTTRAHEVIGTLAHRLVRSKLSNAAPRF